MKIPHRFTLTDFPFRLARSKEPFLLAANIDGTILGDKLGEDWLKRNAIGEKYTAQIGPGWNLETIYAIGHLEVLY